MFIYKPVKTTPLNKKHVAHKSWTITDETAGTFGIVSYSGEYSRGEWSISDTSCANIALERTTSNGYYMREIFDSLYQLYYTDPENYTKSNDGEYLLQQTRNINSSIHAVSIPSNIFGKRLKENSFTMSRVGTTVYDDGIGNLRDAGITSSVAYEFKQHNKSDYHIKIDFNDGWKFINTNPNTKLEFDTRNARLVDYSDGPFTPVGENISFARHGIGAGEPALGQSGVSSSTYVVLHGSQSIESSSNSVIQIENSVVLGANDRAWNDDFAISLWVNAPQSQSRRNSFNGPWESQGGSGIGTTELRTLKGHSSNVITTSRQWESTVPWELRIFNSDHAKKGRLLFGRGHQTLTTNITSSAINDGNWHHVVLQVATSSMQLWLDGVLQEESKTDPMADEAIFDSSTDITIGARPWGNKSREVVGGSGQSMVPPGSNAVQVARTYTYKHKNYIYPFSGSIDSYKIFNKSITPTEVISLYRNYRDSNIVGNIFYQHGIAAITDLSGSYKTLLNDYTLQFNGTTEHTIHNYQCVVEDEEYNMTFNQSARKNQDKNNPRLKGFATASDFTPYITTIGLYSDQNELLAVSKLANPVKSPTDLDIVFNVQFDT